MRGIILAGGLATRLYPLTKTQNKHLLPIWDKPMIYYPIETLASAGIKEILIVVSGPFAGNFLPILKNGEEFGLNHLEFAYQSKPDGGIADALSLAKNFAKNESVAVMLGDNTTDFNIKHEIETFETSLKNSFIPLAKIFIKEVEHPQRFGVPTLKDGQIIKITEKPEIPDSNFAVTGLYLYDSNVFKFIDLCSPSERNELEITSVNNLYIKHGVLEYSELSGFWQDAGTFESLFASNKFWAEKALKH